MSNTMSEQAARDAAWQAVRREYEHIVDRPEIAAFEWAMFTKGWNAAKQHAGETEQEPYGHCDSCGKPCDGSGVCSCGGPIAITKTEPFSKAQENVCECGHTARLHRFGSANFICRVMSPCSTCECPDFRRNYVPPSDEAEG